MRDTLSQSAAGAEVDALACAVLPAAPVMEDTAALPRPPARWRLATAAVVAGYLTLAYGLMGPSGVEPASTTYFFFWYLAVVANAWLFHLGIAVTVLALLAAAGKRFGLCIAAVPLIAMTTANDAFSYLPRRNPPPPGTPHLSLMTYNLFRHNQQYDAALAQILETDADVVALQEYTPRWHEQIGERLKAAYPHSLLYPLEGSYGAAVYSRYPLAEISVPRLVGEEYESQCVLVRHPVRRFALYNIHLMPPTPSYAGYLRRQFRMLREDLQAQRGTAIVAGDFNIVPQSPMYDIIKRMGYADAHETAGRGRGATWPAVSWAGYLPGFRIDHVFVGGGARALSCEVRQGGGSDHRPIVVTIELQTDDGSE